MIHIGKKNFDQKNIPAPEERLKRSALAVASILLIAFGRASASCWLSPLAAIMGYACAFETLLSTPPGKRRFLTAWTLFSVVILIQSIWFLSHPFLYIWGVWLLLSLLLALPYATLSLAVVRSHNPTFLSSAGHAAAFTLVEWGFTCLPCGYSFQSAALHLSWSLWPLQLASVIGAIGLSFIVFWTNITVFFWLFQKKPSFGGLASILAALPYLAGGWLLWHHTKEQTAFDRVHPPRSIAFFHMEEPPDVYSKPLGPEKLHQQEWEKILSLLATVSPKETDLIVLPEGVAPYSAEAPLFDASHLPERFQKNNKFSHPFLSSLDLSRIIASSLQTSVLIGLEGRGRNSEGKAVSYNSCFFIPSNGQEISRYDKQLLLPLGEYIPTPALRTFLSSYGIHDSFTPGEKCVLFREGSLRITPLICYEETFSSYAVAASRLHPNLLVSLSNDCWYPQIRRDHFELARLRTVEIGIPLVRSCNQGVSSAIDALGKTVICRGEHQEAENACVIIPLSQYTVFSIYAGLGPTFLAACLGVIWALAFLQSRLAPEPQQVEHSAPR